MAELTPGTKVKLRNGSSCTVKKELGRGGQGIVYQVDYQGHDYALKWYTQNFINANAFYSNLEENAKKGTPAPNFLWPEAVTEKSNGSFGYVMKLRPKGYEELSAFMLAKVKFASVKILLDACLQICSAFQQLHILGYSYQDMNDGNFFINPQTGHVLICDNDNVAPHGTNMGIAGKGGYMAPEIVDGEKLPDIYTDYFSLSVILFILIFMNRPFEGTKAISCPCLTTEAEKILNGKNSVFILDPSDNSNRPVNGIHTNVIQRWPLFPSLIRDAFIKTFSKDAMHHPEKRVMEKEWLDRLVQVRAMYAKCPLCGKETFHDLTADVSKCIECGKPFRHVPFLEVGRYRIPLTHHQKIYSCQVSPDKDYGKVIGEILSNLQDPTKKAIRNLSSFEWQAIPPDGKFRLIPHQGVVPVIPGVKIKFNKDSTGTIKV
ncbi:MAG: serine/threonine-protein kinase [Muribaculaceae bacterium]|nr:serine/threonine-protein kinase [Muribaculaceae bacterium]